jgi:hypothetical protein
MARRKASSTKAKKAENGDGLVALNKELWQAAVTLRGSIEPADYKRYVLPIIFLRFLSLRYEKRRAELERLVADPESDHYGDTAALDDPASLGTARDEVDRNMAYTEWTARALDGNPLVDSVVDCHRLMGRLRSDWGRSRPARSCAIGSGATSPRCESG